MRRLQAAGRASHPVWYHLHNTAHMEIPNRVYILEYAKNTAPNRAYILKYSLYSR